jgi:molecular chaperone DnaK
VAEAGRVETALDAAKQAVKGEDVAGIRTATSELQEASHAMAEALYRASGPSAQASDTDVKEGEVVDAA